MICFHLCERMLPKSGLGHSVFKTNRMDVFVTHLLGFLFSCNKSPCALGSPCQGSCHRRWLRGSVSLPQLRWCSAAPSSEGAKGIEKLTDLHKKQDNKPIQKLRYLVAICHSKQASLWWGRWQNESFDGGRERGKSLNEAIRPLSLSLANVRQLPHQREPRKRNCSFSRGSRGDRETNWFV